MKEKQKQANFIFDGDIKNELLNLKQKIEKMDERVIEVETTLVPNLTKRTNKN